VTPATALARPSQASKSQVSQANAEAFSTQGDYVHISSTPPRAASGHGWWSKGTGNATYAVVTVQLQINRSGSWSNVGLPGRATVGPGGGAGNRVTARMECSDTTTHEWRSIIDVDVVGYVDSPEKLQTPAQLLPCNV
jgi:hypothetical protein